LFSCRYLAENKAMLDVFRDSGFECRTKMDGAYVEVDFSVAPTEATVSRAELRDRLATVASLRAFFQPASVALIGASRNPASIGGRILSALGDAGFRGAIYPVNPTATKIGALTVYPTIAQVPQPVDLAVVAVPRDAVLAAIDACAARSVRTVVLITAGFAETGP
jgi:predicted CoA-binding protein